MKCPNCDKEITDDSLFCEHCGAKVAQFNQSTYLSDENKTQIINIARDSQPLKQVPYGYVDLGLPSGTYWKNSNEPGSFCTFEDANVKYGNSLPTEGQWKELIDNCKWTWNGKGYDIVGKNGNSISLPAEGEPGIFWGVNGVGKEGHYLSSTLYDNPDKEDDPDEDEKMVSKLYFTRDIVTADDDGTYCNLGLSVRLVK